MYTPIEWMALILIVVAVVKTIVVLVSPKSWFNGVVKPVWGNSGLMGILCVVAAGASLYYLIQSGLSIVQILAVTLFVVFLAAAGMAPYKKELITFADKALKENILNKSWYYVIIWAALLIWGAAVLFAWI